MKGGRNMIMKKCCLCVLTAFCFLLSGCLSATGNLTINEDGSVHYEATMATVDFLKSAIEEQKNDLLSKNSSAKVEPYNDGNLSGYKISADYPSVDEYAMSITSQNTKTAGMTVKEIHKVKGWFYDAYSFDFIMEGNKDTTNDPDTKAMAQAMASQVKCSFTMNLPYPPDVHNADQMSNGNKTLYWNLAPMLTSEVDKDIQVQFKVWHKSHLVITVGIIVILLLVATIFGVMALNARYDSDKQTRGIIAGVAFVMGLVLVGMSLYMLFSAPKFSNKNVIAQTKVEQTQVEKNTSNKATDQRPPVNATKQTASHNSGVITATEVRMRANPSTNANILGYFDKGETVEIINVKPEWVQVKRANGAVGWVSDKFCQY